MRLSDHHRQLLKADFKQYLNVDCQVLLFGSRVRDGLRGGDVDLLVRTAEPMDGKSWLAAMLAARAERLLGGRKVDVLLVDPETNLEAIHVEAIANGILL